MSMNDIYLGVRLHFDTETERQHSQEILLYLLGLICRHNLLYLLRNPNTPPLYESGVVYSPPDQTTAPPISKDQAVQICTLLNNMGVKPDAMKQVLRIVRGAETFLDIPSLYQRGHGDCNELVPVRIAELWRAGVKAAPCLVKPVPNAAGGLSYHTVVVWPDDPPTMEDPSLILGMGGPSRADERREAIRQNKERWDGLMSAAQHLIAAEPGNQAAVAAEVGRKIDLMGLLPRSGRFAP